MQEQIQAEKELIQRLRSFSTSLAHYKNTELMNEKNITFDDNKEASECLNLIADIIEKFHESKNNKLIVSVIDILIDVAESFLISTTSVHYLSVVTAQYLIKTTEKIISKTDIEKLEEIKNCTNQPDSIITGIVKENGSYMTLEELEKEISM